MNLKDIKEIKKIQGMDGNWNYNEYMRGMYNGVELAIAILENRDPVYKEVPETYLEVREVTLQ